jgi:type I restriction enzyme S subunit
VKLGTKVDIIKGVSYSSYELSESTTAMVTLKSFNRGGGYKSDGLKAYTGKFKPEQVLKTGDLVIACTDVTQNADVIGRPAIIRKSRDYETLVASLDIIKLLPKSEDVPLSYLYFMTNSEVFNHHMFSHSTGTTVLHLAKEAIPSFQYAQPSFEIMNVFGRIAHAVLDLINTNENENNILSDYRDNLLHMIF